MPLGEHGDAGVWKQGAKTWEQERNDAKAANQATSEYLKGAPLKDQKMKAATRLSKVAPRIFQSIRANPPEWLPEFDDFIRRVAGKRPSETFRHQAALEHDAFVMGALLSWDYFAMMLAEQAGEDKSDDEADGPAVSGAGDDVSSVPVGAGSDVPAPVPADEPAAPAVDVADVAVADDARPALILDANGNGVAAGEGGSFSLFGADGQLAVEGLK